MAVFFALRLPEALLDNNRQLVKVFLQAALRQDTYPQPAAYNILLELL
jgi:hypothetical protein